MNNTIVIVGGGSAGWMAASYLSHLTQYNIKIIEPNNSTPIGVGESTLPNIVDYMSTVGITEQELFNQCNAVRKYKIQHNNWNWFGDTFHHRFCFADQEHSEQDYWMDNYVKPNKTWRWAYHVDARGFIELMKSKAIGITLFRDDIDSCNVVNGEIKSVTGKKDTYEGDFFIDCTGFKMIIRSALGDIETRGHPCLTNDHAVVCQAENNDKKPAYTITYRMDYGWMWNIALQTRIGLGYVFDSDFIDIDSVKKEMVAKAPIHITEDDLKVIPFNNQYVVNPYKSNCLALGLSAGFLEPLEATGLFLLQYCLEIWVRLQNESKSPEKAYNKLWNKTWKQISNFLAEHYKSTNGDDTEYWARFKNEQPLYSAANNPTLFQQYSFNQLKKARGH